MREFYRCLSLDLGLWMASQITGLTTATGAEAELLKGDEQRH